MENWKNINGFENEYRISSRGEVYSLKTKKILRKGIGTNGYYYVILYKNGKASTYYIHRLVALHYIEKTDNEVDHIDENKLNNNVDNLRWVNRYFNASRSTKGKYRRRPAFMENNPKSKKVYVIKEGTIVKIFYCAKQISKDYNINYSTLKKRLKNDTLMINNSKFTYNADKNYKEVYKT